MAPSVRSAPLHASLAPHPATAPNPAIRRISACLARGEGTLSVRYTLEGALEGVRIPALFPHPAIGHDLWRSTCFELFVLGAGGAYREFNFSPSGAWAIYDFAAYRQGAQVRDASLAPRLELRREAGVLELRVTVADENLMQAGQAGVRLALSAVVEGADGGFSYWALCHPAATPDFHHPQSFALALDEVRH